MDEEQEFRFVCKLCFKKYPCGKSLGGHMRSHVVVNSAESDEKLDNYEMNDSRMVELANGQSSYGLRENPRKSWRASDSTFALPHEKICKQCGKGFVSLKALCGHMACHSDKDRSLRDDHSWTSENQKLVMDSHSDTEAEDRIIRTRSCKGKKLKKVLEKSSLNLPNNNGSSSMSEIDGDEQEEVAMCLMMLSRDGLNSFVESSDNNSVLLETKSSSIDMKPGERVAGKCVRDQEEAPKIKKVEDFKPNFDAEVANVENSDSGYFLDECAKAESDVSVDGFRRNDEFGQSLNKIKSYRGDHHRRKRRYIDENSEFYNNYDKVKRNEPPICETSQKRSKYECFNCKKSFKSYQALGGHRPCHKKSNAYYENILDDSDEFASKGKLVESTSNRKQSVKDKKIKAKKSKGHVCPFCDRVFKNGQALGGHKRSHFIGGHEVNNNPSPVSKLDLLDLNLPAPQDDDDDDDDGNEAYSPNW